ncbi:Autophagy protein 22 [Haplosporangium sp. Z 27]|nr:Autophagy protein 22 [Haplosporangium sp. Z 27]
MTAKVYDSTTTLTDLVDLDLNDYEEKQHCKPLIKPVKKSELWAWYIQNGTYCGYGWVAAALMVPLLIQDMASKAGVEASNHSIPCNTTVPGFKCVTLVMGQYIEPGTISLYISSLSSILSFFMSLSISAVADHGSYRKTLLIAFSVLGCLNALCYFIIQSPSLFWVGAILSPLGWTFFNICGVFSHSYLPLYGRAHPDVLAAEARGESLHVVRKIEEQKINDISAYSVAVANIGAVLINGVCIGISLGLHESALSLQIAIAFTGVWWLVWMFIVSPWLDPRPNDPLPKGTNWVLHSWKKTYSTVTSFRKLPEIFKFMVAWFILSDGVNTIPAIHFIILYRELAFTHVHSLIISVLLAAMATIGAYVFLRIRRLGPLVTGLIHTATNDYRKAFWFPLGLIILGVAILLCVDVDLGKDQARQFAKDKREARELQKFSRPGKGDY